MTRKRRTFTPEFKQESASLVLDQGYSLAQAELLNFAEFLLQKNSTSQKEPSISLLSLAGGLEQSSAFSGSAMSIQDEMRRDWD